MDKPTNPVRVVWGEPPQAASPVHEPEVLSARQQRLQKQFTAGGVIQSKVDIIA